jgi:hypothetical protein
LPRDTRQEPLRYPEVDVVFDAERAGDFVSQKRRYGASGRAAHDLAEQEPKVLAW